MASTSETGHARNVANFERLIAICSGYGAKYNPSNPALQITSLQEILQRSRSSLQDINTQMAAYKKAIGARQSCYTTLRPLVTRVVNALAATDAPAKVKEDCRSINRKIQGARASTGKTVSASSNGAAAAAAEAEPTEKSISTSRQSFDLLAEHFSALIASLSTEPAYKPNETELQLSALQTCYADMSQANVAAAHAGIGLANARILRNNVIYGDKSGLCDIATAVKAYVKSVFGNTSPEYRQVSGIQFFKK
jgi:hypothetical protein